MTELNCGLMTCWNLFAEVEKSDVEKALEDQNLFVPSVIAMRQWGDFDGWEHQLVLDERVDGSHLGPGSEHPLLLPLLHSRIRERNILPSDTGNYLKLVDRKGFVQPLNTLVSLSQFIPSIKPEIVCRGR